VNAKRLMRSLIVFAPRLQGLRFRAEARFIRALRRPYRPEFAGLRALPLQSPLVLDIGCNRGISVETILAMRPDARVTGFEANAMLAADTKRWFAADRRVEILPFGLGSLASAIDIHVPRYRHYRFDGLGSVDASVAERMVTDGWLYGSDPRHLHLETVKAMIHRLDDFNLSPAVIKVYVQGYEREVLEGAAETIRRNQPVILAPSAHSNIEPHLASAGYRRFQWSKRGFISGAEGNLYDYYMTGARYNDLRRDS